MSDMQFCKAQVRALTHKPTDWESFFDSLSRFAGTASADVHERLMQRYR
jgi:hypothetical protein